MCRTIQKIRIYFEYIKNKMIKDKTSLEHNQLEVIENYIKMNTNYALILEGDYGIGKTYFFKKILSPRIQEISLPFDDSKKYRPIHISLFGLKNFEDISRLIFLELSPFLKNKTVKITAGLGKIILRGMMSFNSLGNIDDYISDINAQAKNVINEKEIVFCFDDLDRKSEALSLTELYGYINFMVENSGAKIIIISNDKTFQEKGRNELNKLKEKVVGIHIQYKPDFNSIFKSILKDKYKETRTNYYDFLIKNKVEILNALAQNNYNFRSLIFFLEHFYLIFTSLEEVFKSNVNFNYKKQEKQGAVLIFALAIAFEFKNGNLTEKEFADLELTGNQVIDNLTMELSLNSIINVESDTQIETEETIIERLKNKYASSTDLYPLKSVISYLTGEKNIDIDQLIEELNSYFLSEDENTTDWQSVLNKLKDRTYLNLEDSVDRLD